MLTQLLAAGVAVVAIDQGKYRHRASGHEALELTDDDNFLAFPDLKRRIVRILGQQRDPATASKQAFRQTLAVDKGDYELAVSGSSTFVDGQHVAIEDLDPLHRIAFDHEEEGTDRIADQLTDTTRPHNENPQFGMHEPKPHGFAAFLVLCTPKQDYPESVEANLNLLSIRRCADPGWTLTRTPSELALNRFPIFSP